MGEEKEKRIQRVYRIIMVVVLTAFITFIVTSSAIYTYYTNNPIYTMVTGQTDSELDTTDVSGYLKSLKKYIDTQYLWSSDINEEEMVNAAIKGYLSGLGDEYTEYIPKSEMNDFTQNIKGSFCGIGVYMIADKEKEQIVVYYPIPDSPAEEAGIKSGDIIKSVDGKEYAFEEFSTMAEDIRGEEGTKVTLVIERDGKEKEFEITRAKITTNPIYIKLLEKKVGYISLPSFDSETANNFKDKVYDLINQGAESLIIDLRNNGGGIVDESTNIADYILDKNDIIITTKDNKDNIEITKSEKKPLFNLPIVILVNENTASASEILTGALKDNGKATVVGTTTYGKGIIQSVYTLPDGSGLKITTAEYCTPNGTAINKVGIKPDVEVKLPEKVTNIYAVSEDDDTQLKKAIEILTKGE